MGTILRSYQLQDLAIHQTELDGFKKALKRQGFSQAEKETFKRNIATSEREIRHIKMLLAADIELKELFHYVDIFTFTEGFHSELSSQICNSCIEKLHIPNRLLDEEWEFEDIICGVTGCTNQPNRHIVFEQY